MPEIQPDSRYREQGPGPDNLDKVQAAFIRNVEHELRTPLAIMQGYAELLREGALGELAPEQQEAMFVIVNRAYELRTLVDRIGVLMALEADMKASIPVVLTDIVADMVKDKRPAAVQAGVTLEVYLEPDVPSVSGDPQHLRQALDCLLDNALKFTPSGGRIETRVYTEPGWVCCAIQDTGIGIPEDKVTNLFTGFYQVDGSSTRRYGGIGLGLTIAKSVVEAHAGRIEVQSRPGQGSQFTVKLPLEVVRTDQLIRGAIALRRILVVDDEENVALTLQDALEKLPNCQVTVATSGEQALDLFERQPFDLLITDYKMPGVDGMTLAVRVRQLYPLTAVVMITAYSSDELREQATHACIQRVLDKPVKLAEVRSAAIEVLNHSAGR